MEEPLFREAYNIRDHCGIKREKTLEIITTSRYTTRHNALQQVPATTITLWGSQLFQPDEHPTELNSNSNGSSSTFQVTNVYKPSQTLSLALNTHTMTKHRIPTASKKSYHWPNVLCNDTEQHKITPLEHCKIMTDNIKGSKIIKIYTLFESALWFSLRTLTMLTQCRHSTIIYTNGIVASHTTIPRKDSQYRGYLYCAVLYS